jgi:hypothetical protein
MLGVSCQQQLSVGVQQQLSTVSPEPVQSADEPAAPSAEFFIQLRALSYNVSVAAFDIQSQ